MSAARRGAVFIVCPGHSGSTLLGHFLGAHPNALHIGELVAPLHRDRPFLCRVCEGEGCPIWGSLLTEPFLRRTLRHWRRERRVPWLAGALSRLGGTDLRCALHRRVLEGLPATRIVVDSSKLLSWAHWNRGGAGELRAVYLHLRRDLRGVLASHLGRGTGASPERISRGIARQTRRILDALERMDPADAYSLHYEDLVEAPAEAGAKLCAFLGVEFDPAMLEYWKTPQHVIGGNAGPTYQVRAYLGRTSKELEFLDCTSEANQRFYRDNRPGFIPDHRWTEQLKPAMLEEFERIAGDTNRRLGYPRGGDPPARRNSRST